MTFADSNFLIPNGTFIVEIVAFLVVLAFMGARCCPACNKALDDRAEKIRSELAAADEAKADATEADDERRAAPWNRRATRPARSWPRPTARPSGWWRIPRPRPRPSTSASSGRRHAEVRLARQRAVDEAAARLGELVLDVVERIIGREVDLNAHRDLIDEAVAALAPERRHRRCRGRRAGAEPVNPALEGYWPPWAPGPAADLRRPWPPSWPRWTSFDANAALRWP